MFLTKKIISSFLTLFLVSLISFTVLKVIPGDPLLSKLGVEATEQQIEILNKELGLDKPKHLAYIEWISDVSKGDMGESIRFSVPVNTLIKKNMKSFYNIL
ncbi:MAG: hypothetical protein ACPGDB_02570 [Fusobacterium sp.]